MGLGWGHTESLGRAGGRCPWDLLVVSFAVAARLRRALPGGAPGSETLCLRLLIIFQGPPGHPGIPGLTGSDGPPVRIGSWKNEKEEREAWEFGWYM